jgi:hypothetical protein
MIRADLQTAGGQGLKAGRKACFRHGSRPGRDSEPGPSEREKLRRANPTSGRREKSGRRPRAPYTSGASKRRRRNVLAGASGSGAGDRRRCRGPNLRKAAAIREDRCNRFGSHSEGEPKPERGSFMRATARTAAEAEHLIADCRVYPAQPHRGIAQAIQRYIRRTTPW